MKLIKRKNPSRVLCLTSIGLDGETIDQVTLTPKPEIEVYEGDLFATSEVHYRKKSFLSEVLWVSDRRTALGKVVLSRALESGKVMLSGPSTLGGMRELLEVAEKCGVDFFLLDGALSRRSTGTPFLCDGVILATGAALSLNPADILRKTLHAVELMKLPVEPMAEYIEKLGDGIWLARGGIFEKLPARTILGDPAIILDRIGKGCKLFIPGSLPETFVKRLISRGLSRDITLVVKDYTKVFLSPEITERFFSSGGKLKVLRRPRLLAVTFNPFSPAGYVFNSREILRDLRKSLKIPVIDVMEGEEFE
ncbi:hypothetical protein AT15_08650 [Kosmotoga arenicorallina S304]|uniref:Uncharacterized protein n=1 Tax=Kosmotoga arenicorallina S304 TaxID=1453497 RepID=A0A176K228_9BACT|nr:hypothetical protein [Kosmotoga arenicorallina]OAA31034.1 hypothetical protein AT15_08650 [Kosmotoga arenicorallina S304]